MSATNSPGITAAPIYDTTVQLSSYSQYVCYDASHSDKVVNGGEQSGGGHSKEAQRISQPGATLSFPQQTLLVIFTPCFFRTVRLWLVRQNCTTVVLWKGPPLLLCCCCADPANIYNSQAPAAPSRWL